MTKDRPRFAVGPDFEAEWPDASALATDCVLNLYTAVAQLEAKSEAAVRRAGFPSLAGFNVLTVLDGARTPLPPSVISERIFVTRGTMTTLLHSLERRRLIRMTRHPVDARMRLVEMTRGTRERVRAYRRHVHVAERQLMSALPIHSQRQLLNTLATLQRAIDELDL